MSDIQFPPLPPHFDVPTPNYRKLYSDGQMQEYARQAVLLERERCAKVCEQEHFNKWEVETTGDLREALAAAIRKG